MAPPRKVIHEQLEMLISFLENNRGYANGLPIGSSFLENNRGYANGLPIGSPAAHAPMKLKWAGLAKRINALQGGNKKTPDDWRKFWFEWRHKVRRKASNSRRYQSSRFLPLDDLEIRVLKLSEKTMGPLKLRSIPIRNKKKGVNAVGKDHNNKSVVNTIVDSDENNVNEPFEEIQLQPPVFPIQMKTTKTTMDDSNSERSNSPPPKWAIDLEERRIAAEERIACALESIAGTIKSQEERRSREQGRIADALTSLSVTMHNLRTGLFEAVKHMQSNNTEKTKKAPPLYYVMD